MSVYVTEMDTPLLIAVQLQFHVKDVIFLVMTIWLQCFLITSKAKSIIGNNVKKDEQC